MKSLGPVTLKVADIVIADRKRQIDEDYAQLLAQSLRETGRLRNKPEVRLQRRGKKIVHTLIAGGHRMRAVQIVGWQEVEVELYEGSDDETELWEIDENLIRHDLNPLDRAVFLAARKALYLKLHPETGHGGDRKSSGHDDHLIGFAKDTASRCGIGRSTIDRATRIAAAIGPDIRARIGGTWLARSQSELLALVKLAPSDQHKVLDLLLAPEPTAKNVEAARRSVQGIREAADPSAEKHLAKLLRAWDQAPAPVRRSFLEHLRANGQLGLDTKAAA